MNFDYAHKRARDASEHADSLRGWNQRYEQLSAGSFEGITDELRVGPAQLFGERANQAVLQTGQLGPNHVAIALVVMGDAPGWYCGHRLSGEHLIGVRDSGAFDLVAGAGMEILALSLDTRALHELVAQVDGTGAEPPQVPAVLKPSPQAMTGFRSLACSALALGRGPEGASLHPASRRMLVLSLTDALLTCVGASSSHETLPATAASRQRIVARARQYMQAHAHEVISVPDLCKAIGTSRRALQYAFEEVMQISPVTYLRALRLNQVRTELRRECTATVGEIAARWGFWHPSRFAADYRAMFGELPSATRRPQALGTQAPQEQVPQARIPGTV